MPKLALTLLTLLLAATATAEVVDSAAGGFSVRRIATIGVPPAQVYDTLVHKIGSWWSPTHTFSGDSKNLSIEPRAGGCFCETLPGGGSGRHLTVVYAEPGKILRMTGGLGPLQEQGVAGSLTWSLAREGEGTKVEATYRVGGYVAGGLDAWAAAVDRVVGEQLERLARFVETGSLEPPPAGE